MAKVSVIIPGAGRGLRFGGSMNKIFELLGDMPLFMRTIEAFINRNDVIEVMFVCSMDDMDYVAQHYGWRLENLGVKLVAGGHTRTQSVKNALDSVSEQAELVAIHDAARPCIAQSWIDAVFSQASMSGAALLAVPIHGTVKRTDGQGIVTQTLPRDEYAHLFEAQTPQVFAREIIMKVYDEAVEATDDCALVEKAGYPVSVVMGDLRNIKVTRPEDMDFARQVISTL